MLVGFVCLFVLFACLFNKWEKLEGVLEPLSHSFDLFDGHVFLGVTSLSLGYYSALQSFTFDNKFVGDFPLIFFCGSFLDESSFALLLEGGMTRASLTSVVFM